MVKVYEPITSIAPAELVAEQRKEFGRIGAQRRIPGLTLFADLMGVVGGAFFSIKLLGVDWSYYWEYSRNMVGMFDVFAGMFKSVFFGAAIALICCHQGFRCGAGAEGVGKAATSSFVISFVAILFLDLLLGIGLDQIQTQFLGGPKGSMI